MVVSMRPQEIVGLSLSLKLILVMILFIGYSDPWIQPIFVGSDLTSLPSDVNIPLFLCSKFTPCSQRLITIFCTAMIVQYRSVAV
jgi:hypothetical protein